ncbi:MAG: hypothetical protein HGA53_03095 [Anaerolineaceae bacterium]|jgi:hypothetical protein|nr:hypothetical protein [Anaerolineaceae bacterium]NTV35917.1 hypothetical protein [Anaerolineaceae bacterium]
MSFFNDWKNRLYIVGGILGAVIGVFAAYTFIQRADAQESRPKVTAGDGVKVGLGVMTVLRTIADLGTRR